MFLILDDEKMALRRMAECINEIDPTIEYMVFQNVTEADAFAQNNEVDVAFLDISMAQVNGIDFARQLKEYHPGCNIVFTTGYSEYYPDAFHIGASDYLLKPITVEKVRHAMQQLRHPIESEKSKLTVTCFGHFEVYYGNRPLHFARTKTKELLAYLIYRRGTNCTRGDIMNVLWKDENLNYYGVCRKDLADTLKNVGLPDVLSVNWKSISVNTKYLSCDWLTFLAGDESAASEWHGEFMLPYEWALPEVAEMEKRLALIEEKKQK